MSFKFKVGDVILIFIFLIIGIVSPFLLLGKSDNVTAQIIKDKNILYSINLNEIDKPVTYKIDDKFTNYIVAEKGRIRFSSSNCPDEVCVHKGWISRSGQTIVCLPNGVIIKIIGQSKNNDIDAILN